jgi:hypothetical protein
MSMGRLIKKEKTIIIISNKIDKYPFIFWYLDKLPLFPSLLLLVSSLTHTQDKFFMINDKINSKLKIKKEN